ncbi:MAG TPA: proton-conducting transporter membrane subunit [Solirubrobacteraceae bacterium]|jgi:multicomponent Na+:H+ antiporter subunit D|nr:proton-conducting transporter membrane subunit [Solirubrobacteraceae bacterium]
MSSLGALPVLVAMLGAGVLVASSAFIPRAGADALATSVTAGVLVLCALLLHRASQSPFAYWLGGWRPRGGVTIGISLSIDPMGAGVAMFAALLVLAALVYSIHYFEAVEGLFHGLMLVFLAAMAGFSLTGDLFDLIVFFELMSTVAYALTAYHIEERAPIQGAINFAITNSIAGYAMFVAVALLYARTGALNLAQIGAALDHHHADPLVIVAFALLAVGFLTKAAVVPLHFWLADAHAVAPAPVCVLFSGVMVELGVYAVARLYWEVFAGALAGHVAAVRAILVALGVATALLGALMCVLQRHVKRLLAFSTISHVGVMVCGIGLLTPGALAGVATYAAGHGLAKAALFMLTGVLLHRFATVDEYDLHGRGRGLRVTGVLFAFGGVLLAAVPPLTMFAGKSLIEDGAGRIGYGWLSVVCVLVSMATGGAVLRVAGRVFMGWGPSEGPDPAQARAAEERVDETRGQRDRTPWPMLVVPAVLLALGAAAGLVPGLVPRIASAAARFTDHPAYAAWVLHAARPSWPAAVAVDPSGSAVLAGVLSVVGAVAVAALGLFGRSLPQALPRAARERSRTALRAVRHLHSGHIGDYIAWWTAGAAAVGATCLLALR